ncbi:SGNH/GDSL hydrolase family protein [Actinokineospora sp. PR83]|uniref:SGNH/GDSL hydrolase family protein n=1 Tax=Actinokineospora sp. PR83 TaxID=2884908 RepID=UPI0027DF2CE9|nr:SGNH/GDSL hydrolase family protein [Actinokineospora sp. PR83]MCG8915738.1 SGNH/GDSL hydrolase family protein [Actinokineospora sp. PR83]
MPRSRLISTAPVLALLACVGLGAGTSGAADPLEYVALGDSAAAGPLIPQVDPNLLCLRSRDNDYPAVAARILGARLTDVTCSGATTAHFTSRQFGLVSPQFDALKPTTDLVSLTIGGNDVSLVQLTLGCLNLLPEPLGRSCADQEAAKGNPTAAKIDAWAPTLGTALDTIHARSPHAEVVVAGYGTYVRPGGCHPTQPIWARDADFVQSLVNRLNAALRAQAEAHGATYVDIAAVSEGHDTCAAPAQRYLEGLIPTSAAAPLHPNAAGMAAFGTAVAAAAR